MACEQTALVVLRKAGIETVEARLHSSGGAFFLEVSRFDRIGERGRRSVLSLAAVDLYHFSYHDNWAMTAERLENARLMSPQEARKLKFLDAFSRLIGDTDRHFHNIALFLDATKNQEKMDYRLAPAFDKLPMLFAPVAGQIPARDFTMPAPNAAVLEVWGQACKVALEFWSRVSETKMISASFRKVANRCLNVIRAGMGLVALFFLGLPAAQAAPFKWCVATSAHQIEGHNTESDWWDFEQLPGAIKNGERSGAACDHWNRLEEDVQLLVDLHVQQYRFSVEWAKIESKEGEWNRDAIRHYRKEVLLLLQNKIEPFITLHHFTFPRWVRAKGGWEWAGIQEAFAKFAALVFSEIAPEARNWVTVNEPMVHLAAGFLAGVVPPQEKRDLQGFLPPLLGLLRSHAAAYQTLQSLAQQGLGQPVPVLVPQNVAEQGEQKLRIGMAHHLRVFDPDRFWHPLDRLVASWLDRVFNWALPEALQTGRLRFSIPFLIDVDESIPALAKTQDFIGVNYYSRDFVRFKSNAPLWFELRTRGDAPKNDMGWEIYPEGFYRVLVEAAKHFPQKPILVTENGIADAGDAKRQLFLKDHLKALQKASSQGVPIETYCHWSLMDNFEWIDGFSPRFGLIEVEYATKTRRIRPSGYEFAEWAARPWLD